jgi:PleD family two-component response regulator
MIQARLKEAGMKPIVAVSPIDFSAPYPLLLDLTSVAPAVLERCAKASMAGLHRQIIMIDLSGCDSSSPDAIILRRDRDIEQIPARLASLARRALRAREVRLRLETASSLGAEHEHVDPEASPQVLYLGDGSELFLSLQGALKERGLSVTAALSLLTAQQYMESRRFSAAIVDLTPRARDASAFIDWTAPAGGPAASALFALVRPGQDLSEAQQAALAQASEVIVYDGSLASLSAQIERHARRYMVSAPLWPRSEFRSKISDLNTGAFTQRFMLAHLERQMQAARAGKEQLSLVTLSFGGVPATRVELKALAAAALPILRETDCPGLANLYALSASLPGTSYRAAIALAQRIENAVRRMPGLDSDRLIARVIEMRAYHTPKTFLSAGLPPGMTSAA